mmetsp:Transcript_7090/g.20174  ORF Transcript_7090/g.20174 Transcript_7090/m.20174 type:complete len:235 (-) Transcript_7090:2192-2896(-)
MGTFVVQDDGSERPPRPEQRSRVHNQLCSGCLQLPYAELLQRVRQAAHRFHHFLSGQARHRRLHRDRCPGYLLVQREGKQRVPAVHVLAGRHPPHHARVRGEHDVVGLRRGNRARGRCDPILGAGPEPGRHPGDEPVPVAPHEAGRAEKVFAHDQRLRHHPGARHFRVGQGDRVAFGPVSERRAHRGNQPLPCRRFVRRVVAPLHPGAAGEASASKGRRGRVALQFREVGLPVP